MDLIRVRLSGLDAVVTVPRAYAESGEGMEPVGGAAVRGDGRAQPPHRTNGRRIKPRRTVEESAANKRRREPATPTSDTVASNIAEEAE